MFSGYRDVTLIGEGGLGRVYRAVKTSTGGVVAIKELPEVPSASPAWHRAKRELEAMLRLKGHPYVVSVEEIIDAPGGPCLVMEYLEGGTLLDRVANGPLSLAELVLVGQQVTQALAAAHAVGIVHRDVKPHNLLVGAFGQVKVADFGIAALTREAGLHTRTQAFTLAYASPEELDGSGEIGPASDTFSFAATMSHLATGRKPMVRTRSVADDLATLEHDPEPAATMAQALIRCLAIDPAARPTMNELHRVFTSASATLGDASISGLPVVAAPPTFAPPQPGQQVAAHGPHDGELPTIVRRSATDPVVVAPAAPAATQHTDATATRSPTVVRPHPKPAPSRRRGRRTVALVVAAVAAITGTIVFAANKFADDSGPSPTLLATLPGQWAGGFFSPDGATVLTGGYEEAGLWNSANGRPLATLDGHADRLESVSFSPDGTAITTSADGTAKLWNTRGELLTTINHGGEVHHGAASPDGKTILTASSLGTAQLWSTDGELLATLDLAAKGGLSAYFGAFSPDGKTILVASDDGAARLWNTDGELLATLNIGDDVPYGEFSPDGATILTFASSAQAQLWNVDGELVVTLGGHDGPLNWATFSPDGTTILTAGDDGTARLWNTDGEPLATLTSVDQVPIRYVVFSPDGNTILTTSEDGTARLWTA